MRVGPVDFGRSVGCSCVVLVSLALLLSSFRSHTVFMSSICLGKQEWLMYSIWPWLFQLGDTDIFTASPSLDSSFMPEAAEGIHPAGYRVLKPPPPILSSTQGWQFHLSVRTDLPGDVLLSLFLSLQAWRPTWSPAGRWSLTLTVAALSWGLLGTSTQILIAPPPGCTHLTGLLPHAPCPLTVFRWENDMIHQQCCGGSKSTRGIIFHRTSVLPQEERWAAFSATTSFCSLCTFCLCGSIESFFFLSG